MTSPIRSAGTRTPDAPGLPPAFLGRSGAGFVEFLASYDPGLLPSHGAAPDAPHGTTIVSVAFPGGVVMAGDRRATMGNVIASRDIEKVYPADDHSCVGIAGTAGIAVELVRLFQVELEHYEKIEGAELSIEGKANRLSAMIRGNLGMAFQGLAVVPMFAGYDAEGERGRIYSYDVTGGCYEETGFHAVGSGSAYARGSLKKLYRPDLDPTGAVSVCLEALYDAADDDSATGGPDLARGIFPVVAIVDSSGYRRVDEGDLEALVREVVGQRLARPDGPLAELPPGEGS